MNIIDGKTLANQRLAKLGGEISALITLGRRPPHLVVILIGDDPASHIYVQHKAKACARVGMKSQIFHLDKQVSTAKVLELIRSLNQDPEVDGILLQLPVPAHLHAPQLISALAPHKDVDGLTPHNQGLLALGHPHLVPCTPLGIIELLEGTHFPFEGCRAVVVGRSTLVGSPVARLLEQRGATVTVVHSKTREAWKHCCEADLLVVAAGKHHLVRKNWVKKGAVIIDVGIHRVAGGSVEGDVLFAEVAPLAQAITPVPGGVGPMTIACLLANCLKAYLTSPHRAS